MVRGRGVFWSFSLLKCRIAPEYGYINLVHQNPPHLPLARPEQGEKQRYIQEEEKERGKKREGNLLENVNTMGWLIRKE